jgi:hypothetical protein
VLLLSAWTFDASSWADRGQSGRDPEADDRGRLRGDGAVEEVQGVDDGEQAQYVIAARGGLCGCVRWRGHLRRDIDHGFPQKFFS